VLKNHLNWHFFIDRLGFIYTQYRSSIDCFQPIKFNQKKSLKVFDIDVNIYPINSRSKRQNKWNISSNCSWDSPNTHDIKNFSMSYSIETCQLMTEANKFWNLDNLTLGWEFQILFLRACWIFKQSCLICIDGVDSQSFQHAGRVHLVTKWRCNWIRRFY
jgi:hypothetical protein